jgi:hypothetical protein
MTLTRMIAAGLTGAHITPILATPARGRVVDTDQITRSPAALNT